MTKLINYLLGKTSLMAAITIVIIVRLTCATVALLRGCRASFAATAAQTAAATAAAR